MRHLIPARRTDKNGVTSTKWVKPATGPAIEGTAIPMPIASVQKPMDLTYEVLITGELLHSENDTVHTKRMINDNLRYIGERDTGLLRHFKTVALENHLAAYLLRNLIKKDGFYEVNSPMSNRDPDFDPAQGMQDLKTALHMIPLFSRLEERLGNDEFECGADGFMVSQSIIRKLKLEGVTGLSAERTVALAMVTYIRDDVLFYGGDEESSLSDSDDAIDYIVDHLDEVESLLPELRARKADDRQTIQSLVEAPAQAVRDGIL